MMIVKLQNEGEHLLQLSAAGVLSRTWREGERKAMKHKASGKNWDRMTWQQVMTGKGKESNETNDVFKT